MANALGTTTGKGLTVVDQDGNPTVLVPVPAGGGSVQSVTAAAVEDPGITVDNTDPANPKLLNTGVHSVVTDSPLLLVTPAPSVEIALSTGVEGAVLQTVGGAAVWSPTDPTSLVVQPLFTSNSNALVTIIDTASIPAYAAGLPLNSFFRLAVFTVVRDTGANFFCQENSVKWLRLAAGPLAFSLDQGPQPTFSPALANVVGTSISVNGAGSGIQIQFGGDPGGIHLLGTMKLYLQVIATPAAV